MNELQDRIQGAIIFTTLEHALTNPNNLDKPATSDDFKPEEIMQSQPQKGEVLLEFPDLNFLFREVDPRNHILNLALLGLTLHDFLWFEVV